MKRFLFILLSFVFSFSLVSAYYGGSPIFDFLYNENVHFALIFILFFSVVFFSLTRKTFKDAKGIAVAISFVIAFFISFGIAQRGLYYGYFGETFGTLALAFVLLFGMFFIIRISYDIMHNFGVFFAIGAIFLFTYALDLSYFFPYGVISDFFYTVHNYLNEGNIQFGFGIVIAVCVAGALCALFKNIEKNQKKTP